MTLKPIGDEGRFRILRFWLNILFIVAAGAGMILWYSDYRELATYLLIGSIFPKFIEVSIRLLRL
jgi:hypothetical protein